MTDAIDIRRPVDIEMEYIVLQPGHRLHPNLHFFNEEGVYLFVSGDLDPDWEGPRPAGRYRSAARVPGNLLSEGALIVGAAISTLIPAFVHVDVPDAVAFHVVDTMEGDSARGEYGEPIPGVVRPLLFWKTQFSANGHHQLSIQARNST